MFTSISLLIKSILNFLNSTVLVTMLDASIDLSDP